MFSTLMNSIEYELRINKEEFSSEIIENYIKNYEYKNEFDNYLLNIDEAKSKKIKILMKDQKYTIMQKMDVG